MPYRHLTKDDRLVLSALHEKGVLQKDIAETLGVDPSTISRELQRNKLPQGRYEGRVAHRNARSRIRVHEKKLAVNETLRTYVIDRIMRYWSPEQVAGRLERTHGIPIVCPETIYQYIYENRQELIPYLRHARGRRYRRRPGTLLREQRREEAKKKRIDARPRLIEQRQRVGDWEGDTIVGKERTVHILTHTERKSGLLLADKAEDISAEAIHRLTVKRFKRIPRKKRLSCTYDNGIQFACHDKTEQRLSMPIFFAYPYHSWERGTNENTNGLLRQFFPKGLVFGTITKQQIDRAVKLINHRPRKRHRYLTPYEVFKGNCTSG